MRSVSEVDISTTQAVSANGSITLMASFGQRADGNLHIHTKIINQGEPDIYVFNRLWTLDNSNRPVQDPQSVYRFVSDGSLNLLFGIAPLPHDETVLYKNIPYVTMINSKSVMEFEVSIPIPVREYNIYFEDQTDSTFDRLSINNVDLSVQYLEENPNIKTHASVFDPLALELLMPLDPTQIKILLTPKISIQLEVLRRSGDFSRLALPENNQ